MTISITPRRIAIGLLGLLLLSALLVVLVDIGRGTVTILTYIDALAMGIFGVLIWLTWRGWAYAPYVLIVVVTLLAGGALNEPFLTQQFSLGLLLPAIVALVLAGPEWILGSACCVLGIILFRAGWRGVYTDPFALILYGVSVGGLVLGRLVATHALEVATHAQAEAEAAAVALQTANASLEQRVAARTAEVQAALREVEAHAAEQAQLLAENAQQREAIRDMSVPVLPVSPTTLVMPLVGALDSDRLGQVQQQALQHIQQASAKYLILDITGVIVVDSQVAQGLIQVVQAAHLLGAEIVLVGIRPEVAQAIIGLGIQLEGVLTRSTLQEGIAHTLRRAPVSVTGVR
jgi:rsbT co-antagonist protein RsbR